MGMREDLEALRKQASTDGVIIKRLSASLREGWELMGAMGDTLEALTAKLEEHRDAHTASRTTEADLALWESIAELRKGGWGYKGKGLKNGQQ